MTTAAAHVATAHMAAATAVAAAHMSLASMAAAGVTTADMAEALAVAAPAAAAIAGGVAGAVPAVPAVTAAPAQAGTPGIAAPVEAGAAPADRIPTEVPPGIEEELRLLEGRHAAEPVDAEDDRRRGRGFSLARRGGASEQQGRSAKA